MSMFFNKLNNVLIMTNIELFLKENFDGMEAYVSSGGLHIDGSVEQKCKLVFQQYVGLVCFIKLEYNRTKLDTLVREKMSDLREALEMSYDVKNAIVDELTTIIKGTYVQMGIIYSGSILSINSSYIKNLLRDCELKYEDGSIVKIRCVQPIK